MVGQTPEDHAAWLFTRSRKLRAEADALSAELAKLLIDGQVSVKPLAERLGCSRDTLYVLKHRHVRKARDK